MAAAELGRRLGNNNVLTLDIGGTTAKTSAVRDGEVRIDTLHHIGRTPSFAGYPVQVPTVEIIEIGAGGGSIVWSDSAGGLHVGPRSAGADPGPACYGRGGSEPTLTDANLLLGRLDPDYFLGGTRKLDVSAAEKALAGLGRQVGADASSVARGVLRYAVAQMSHALRLVTLRRGHDPRDFVFVAYGGAGPLHAALLARELGISRTVIPPGPGHFSAFGMLASPLRGEAVRTVVGAAGRDRPGRGVRGGRGRGAGRARRRQRREPRRTLEVRGTPVRRPGAHSGGPGPRSGRARRCPRCVRTALPGQLLVPAGRTARGRLAPGRRDAADRRRSAGRTRARRARGRLPVPGWWTSTRTARSRRFPFWSAPSSRRWSPDRA